ncbi:MAG: hypothetical protein R3C05_16305 [Pirellulaceae bacterium]
MLHRFSKCFLVCAAIIVMTLPVAAQPGGGRGGRGGLGGFGGPGGPGMMGGTLKHLPLGMALRMEEPAKRSSDARSGRRLRKVHAA